MLQQLSNNKHTSYWPGPGAAGILGPVSNATRGANELEGGDRLTVCKYVRYIVHINTESIHHLFWHYTDLGQAQLTLYQRKFSVLS